MSGDNPTASGWSRNLKLSAIVPAGLILGFVLRELIGTAGLIGMLLALVTIVAVRQEMRWRRPRERLLNILMDVADGAGPISALDEIEGELKQLVPILRRLLTEARHKHFEVRKLEAELPQRVAKRTDALERTIGRYKAQAEHDSLTHLLNRRCFDRDLQTIIGDCRTGGADIAVVVIDLDHFKHVNDELGHAAGDDLLRQVAQVIKSGIRERDLAYRIGGDEFCLLLPEIDEAEARAMVARLKETTTAMVKPLKLTPPPALSVGIATRLMAGDCTGAQLVALADRELYKHKAGRPGGTRRAA